MNKPTMTARWMGHSTRWDMPVRKWRCELRHQGRRMSVMFYQGMGHDKAPTVDDVLECLASDASGCENASSFEDWCAEYGEDTDSRKAESVYRQACEQTERLKALLGDDYSATVYPTA